jgi:uncharacterized protein (TIGR02679 family)
LAGFRGKYASFGTAAGRVFLKDLSHTDIEVLEGFFQKSFHGKKHVALSASEFQKALDKSRFTGIVLDQLLAYCYGAGLKSNKAMRQETYSARMDMFRRIAEEMPGTPGAGWIMRISTERMPVTQMITRHYRTDQEGIHKLLRYTARALNHLPAGLGKVEYLAVFSARITGDPHYFDEGNEANTLLRHGLESLMGAGAAGPGSHTFPAFQKQELLLKAGILKDDLSNHTVACGIHAWKKDGSPHEGVEGFWRCRESMYLTLATVAGLGRVSCEGGVIYIFENPSVYSVLTAGQEGRKSFLCMNGQPHMAAILLMDGLAAAGTVMYYAGDFDPEGLWIAQRLKLRYGANLCFLGMDREHYRRVMSPVPVVLWVCSTMGRPVSAFRRFTRA